MTARADSRMRRSSRLRSKSDFRLVRELRRTVRDDVLSIGWRRTDLPVTRLGLSISVRGLGAVGRNRVKRIVREAFRLRLPSLPPGYDLVVSARDREAAMDLAKVQASFDRLLPKIMRQAGAS